VLGGLVNGPGGLKDRAATLSGGDARSNASPVGHERAAGGYATSMRLARPEAEPTTDVLTVLKTREVVDILEDAGDAFETVALWVIPAVTAGISASRSTSPSWRPMTRAWCTS
jgi:hypothetical protein